MSRRLVAVLLLGAAASVAGCAITPGSTRESVGEAIHSITTSNAIQWRYQRDRVLAPLALAVETDRREVFVSGLVQNDAQRDRAVAIALDTAGVLAAYFVDMDTPGRPVSRGHFRAGADQVWTAAVAAVRAAGYQIVERQDGRTLVTGWRRLPPSWWSLWLATRERMRLSLYSRGDVVTVIALADRLDEASLSWQLERERVILGMIRDALGPTAAPRS